jgi:hypothetical protein
MPVILEAKDFEQWGQGDTKDAAALMKPADEDTLQRWPVSKRVNSSRAADDDPTLIEIEAGVATRDEILAANNFFARVRFPPSLPFSLGFLELRRARCKRPSDDGCP